MDALGCLPLTQTPHRTAACLPPSAPLTSQRPPGLLPGPGTGLPPGRRGCLAGLPAHGAAAAGGGKGRSGGRSRASKLGRAATLKLSAAAATGWCQRWTVQEATGGRDRQQGATCMCATPSSSTACSTCPPCFLSSAAGDPASQQPLASSNDVNISSGVAPSMQESTNWPTTPVWLWAQQCARAHLRGSAGGSLAR